MPSPRHLPTAITRELRRIQAESVTLDSSEAGELLGDALAGRVRLTPFQLEQARRSMPHLAEHVWAWIYAFTGVRIARNAVCRGHSAPLDMFVQQVLTRPPLALWHGPRGGGKSFLSALDTHLSSRFNPRHGTRILGGSKAQSEQIYQAIRDAVVHGAGPLGNDSASIARLLKTEASYVNGSDVSILAASPTSVRGPHVPSLKLDEVDEIEPDIREAAFGMCMNDVLTGASASVLMTSTWHRAAGPMAELIAKGRAGEYPVHTFCIFEVLERCPDERSGRSLENCPRCPLQPWCHDEWAPAPANDRTHAPGTLLPKAKRSDGHYSIEALIQKVRGVSRRVFEADYLSTRPKAFGVWFHEFDDANVSEDAEVYPDHPVHCSTDCGVWTGSVWFQTFRDPNNPTRRRVHVFGEYLDDQAKAGDAARAILAGLTELAGDVRSQGLLKCSMDAAGGAANPVGKTVLAEYHAAGLTGSDGDILTWDRYPGSVQDTLQQVESLVLSADGERSLLIHPRCKRLIAAMESYRRRVVAGQITDEPMDPQHPEEEMIDALRGGLAVEYPTRNDPGPKMRRRSARDVF